MEHDHSIEAIQERLSAGPRHNYLRDWIYGGIDGSVTTFAVVTGVVGAQLSAVVIVIMGLANLVGDGFSMAASNFLGTLPAAQLSGTYTNPVQFNNGANVFDRLHGNDQKQGH